MFHLTCWHNRKCQGETMHSGLHPVCVPVSVPNSTVIDLIADELVQPAPQWWTDKVWMADIFIPRVVPLARPRMWLSYLSSKMISRLSNELGILIETDMISYDSCNWLVCHIVLQVPQGLTRGSGCVYPFHCLFHIIVFLLHSCTQSVGTRAWKVLPFLSSSFHHPQPPSSAFRIYLEERRFLPRSITSPIVFLD